MELKGGNNGYKPLLHALCAVAAQILVGLLPETGLTER